MPDSRRSVLQGEILLHLKKGPIKTITALADTIGALRPSVSRSLNTLKAQELVIRTREGWTLTDKGIEEAEIIEKEFADMVKSLQLSVGKAADIIGRLGIADIGSDLFNMSNIVNDSIRPVFDLLDQSTTKINTVAFSNLIPESSIFNPLDATLQDLNIGAFSGNALASLDAIGALSDTSLLRFDIGQAIKPILDVQERQSEIMRQLSGISAPLEGIFSRNNLLIAGVLEDVFTIRQFSLLPENSGRFQDILANLSDVNQSFGRLFDNILSQFDLIGPQIDLSRLSESVVVPTMTVGYYTRSIRETILVETNESNDPEIEPGNSLSISGDDSLDRPLAKLLPEFAEMRRGTWWALNSRGPDYLRHAGASQRELLRQLLELLVPVRSLPEENRQGTHLKARLRVILKMSESDAEYVDNMCKAIVSQYDQLNKYTHHNKKHESICRAVLHTGEGIIRFVLAYLDLAES